MKIEYEATFAGVNENDIRKRLQNVGAKLIKPKFLQKRTVFHLPEGHEIEGGWARVRDEGDRITMSIKIVNGKTITDQKEICIIVDDINEAARFLTALGCREKAYQESKRELWKINNVEIAIDEWPFLEPFVEIEGRSEKAVRRIAKQLKFDWVEAKFCAVGTLYAEKYKMPEKIINDGLSKLIFDMKNPFIKN